MRPHRLLKPIFLATASLVVASLIVTYWINTVAVRAEQQMERQLQTLKQLSTIGSTLKDAETGQRGYLLTGDESYLKPYNKALGPLRDQLAGLQTLAAAGDVSKDKMNELAALIQKKVDELAKTVRLWNEKQPAAALAEVRSNRGERLIEQIRSRLDEMQSQAQSQYDEAVRQASWTRAIRSLVFGFIALLTLVFLGWAYRAISIEARGHEAAALEISRQKELLATTLASIGDGVIATDLQGHCTLVNGEAERLTGWKMAEATGHPLPEVFRIINERTRQPAENPVDKVIRTGKVAGLANHTVLVAKDGVERIIDDSAAPIRQADGSLCGIILIFRDATRQRKAQQATARLAAIVEHSGDAIITKNLHSIVQTWNAAAERLFGYKAEEIIGKPVTAIFPQDRLSEEDHILDVLRQGKLCERFETIRVAKDGRRIPVSASISPLKDEDGTVIGASKILRDITEIVAAREALLREKEVLATTLASIGDGVIVTDEEGRVTFLNEQAERLTGWKTPEAAGRPLPEVFRIVNEDTRQTVENPVQKALRLGCIVGLANHTLLVTKDGREISIDDSAAPIREEGGPLHGVVLVFRDFTERKRAEEALRRAHAQLANRAVHLETLVQERTAKLQEMVSELQHVSYAISHDMRAPLRAMSTFASILLDEPAGEAQNRQEYSRRIVVAANRLDHLIQDALHYTRACT